MTRFKHEGGDWTGFRQLPGKVAEVDFHHGHRDPDLSYWDAMDEVYEDAKKALEQAQAGGADWLILRHGSSTSDFGKTTARSMIRRLMRSRDSTPFVRKSESIQHKGVFVAAIRVGGRRVEPLKGEEE